MKVNELIELLKTYPQDLPVVLQGNYGDFNRELSKEDLEVEVSHMHTYEGIKTLRFENIQQLAIHTGFYDE